MQEHLKPLLKSAVTRKFNHGATVLYQGEAPRSACILIKGMVRVVGISTSGDEQIVTYHVEGEFFPTSWIFGKAPTTLFFYETVGECEIAFIPRNELIDYILATEERTHTILDYFTTNYTASLIRISALEQPKARDKLLYTLYYLCERYGMREKQKTVIQMYLTHQHLAGLVGITRETAATEMSKLKKQGILTYKKQRYSIDKEKLLQLIGEESFRGINIR